MKITCINCRTVNSGERRICRFCGAPLDAAPEGSFFGTGETRQKEPPPVFRDGLMMLLSVMSLIGFGPITGFFAVFLAVRDIQRIKNAPDPSDYQSHQAVSVACLFISLFGSLLYGFIYFVLISD